MENRGAVQSVTSIVEWLNGSFDNCFYHVSVFFVLSTGTYARSTAVYIKGLFFVLGLLSSTSNTSPSCLAHAVISHQLAHRLTITLIRRATPRHSQCLAIA